MKKFVIILAGCAMLLLGSSCVVHTRPAHTHTRTVVVKKAPRYHKVVVIKGKRYYTWNGKYYKKTRRGYVVVKV
ncbi:MAG: hypothetical protein QNJ57_02460 [Flavobacteriaceae bacterium]|nr:hypothetical protein [Flavobacteriaceae bacterium]